MIEFPRLYPDFNPPDPDALKRPPLTQRVAQFWFDVSQEEFDEKIPSWLEAQMNGNAFQKKQVTEQWEFRVEIKEKTMPRPKATLTQIPKLIRTVGVPLTLEICPPHVEQGAWLKITQPRTDEHPTRFEDFQSECTKALKSILDHLQIGGVKQLAMTYRNEIRKDRYPGFWNSDVSVKLNKVFQIYRLMPNPILPTFEPNFTIDFTRQLSAQESRALRIRFFPDVTALPWKWLIELTFVSRNPALATGGLEIIQLELAGGHSYISEEFYAQFCPEALALFSQ